MEERFLKFPLVGKNPEDVVIILSVDRIYLFTVFEAFLVNGQTSQKLTVNGSEYWENLMSNNSPAIQILKYL